MLNRIVHLHLQPFKPIEGVDWVTRKDAMQRVVVCLGPISPKGFARAYWVGGWVGLGGVDGLDTYESEKFNSKI